MTHITLPRATVEQALEALELANVNHWWGSASIEKAITALRAALPQQAEPVEPVLQTCNCRWDGDVQVQQCTLHEAHVDAIYEWAERAKVAERKLAQQAEPVCTDCRGVGYDASGQLCGCQDKPSPCAYPNCVGGQAGTICKPSCPGGTK